MEEHLLPFIYLYLESFRRYAVFFICRLSRWSKVVNISTRSADEKARAILQKSLIAYMPSLWKLVMNVII